MHTFGRLLSRSLSLTLTLWLALLHAETGRMRNMRVL